MKRHKPQWDDWRCYRCNRRQPADGKRYDHLTPAGYTFAVCVACAKAVAS